MGKLTPQGYVADQLTDILEQFISGLKSIYGNDVLVDADDPDGQLAGILAQMRADIEGVILLIYQANDPDNATGVWLEQKVAYAGLERREASYSYLRDVLFKGEPRTQIKSGALMKDDSGEQWLTETAVTLGDDGTAVNDLRSQDLGQFTVAAGTELQIVTLINGWDSATVQTVPTSGNEEETDPELLNRFYHSRSKPSVNAVDSTVGDIYALPDVKSVIPLENRGDEVDSDGTNPHTVRYIIDGGDNDLIAQAIYNNWPGTGLQGDIEVDVIRPRSGRSVSILFDRPTPVDMQAVITVGRRKDFTTIDDVSIANDVESMKFDVGEPVYQDDIVEIVKSTDGAYVKSILIGRKGETLADVPVVPVAVYEQARFLDGDVTVTVTDD